MSNVNTSGELIHDATDLCISIIDMLSNTIKNMQDKYRNAGNDWSDSKYQQLGEIVSECGSSIKKTLSELSRCSVALDKIAQTVMEYENVNITSASGGASSVGSITSTTGMVSGGGGGGIFMGGSFKECKKKSNGKTQHVHHMPPNCISNPRNSGFSLISRSDGPAIIMDIDDHKKTASYGRSNNAREYREKLARGSYRDALQEDINDIRFHFGVKYDTAINELLTYVERLESERGQIW